MRPYLTVRETLQKNGERHLANALVYSARGMEEHSAGSLRKARRNFARARALGCEDARTHAILAPMLESLARGVAEQIMDPR